MQQQKQRYVNHGVLVKVLVIVLIPVLIVQSGQISFNNDFKAFGLFFDSPQKQPMLTYSDSNSKFQINYPNNWAKSVKINDEISFVAPKEQDSVSSPAGLVIKVFPTQSKNVSIESVAKSLVSKLKTDHKDFKMESSKYYKIGGKKAIQIVFTATDNKLQFRKAMQIVSINTDKVFVITYKASPDKYSNYEKTINDMLVSFRFLNK